MMTAFICNYAGYPCVLFRYSVGTIPVSFLNTFEKYLGSVKPTAKAMLLSVSSVLRNISHAFLIRIWRTKSTGVIPVVAFTLLYSTLRLIPISFEMSSILSSGLPAFSTTNLKMKYFHAIDVNEGIVQGMVEDNQGRIWVIRESSIDCVNPKTGQCNVFGPNDFDFNMSFSQSRPYHDPASNNISVGTPMGLITFNPATLKKSNYQPKVIFCSLHYSGEKESEPILHKDKVVIPANKRNLTINFASLDYQRKYQTRYLYRIDGFTAPGVWISNGSSNTIGFNRISHGDYVLKVRATNSHGVWSKYVAELPIEVRPTFWESIWGKFLMLLLLFGIVGAIFYTYNQRQRENVTHEMSVMKNEFYNDAANRLRTPLTLIGAPVKTVLDTEPGITRKGKELLKMVADNANEMLVMLDKVQRYGNKADFHTNSGLSEEDYDLAEKYKNGGGI
jgi:hypothetical protein